MKGEFDDKLEWPIVSDETLSVTLGKHQTKSFWNRITKYFYLCNLSKCVEVSNRAVETSEKFADNHTVMSDFVKNDLLTFTVELGSRPLPDYIYEKIVGSPMCVFNFFRCTPSAYR